MIGQKILKKKQLKNLKKKATFNIKNLKIQMNPLIKKYKMKRKLKLIYENKIFKKQLF